MTRLPQTTTLAPGHHSRRTAFSATENTAMNNEDIDSQIDRLYSTLPDIRCQGLCHPACGPIFVSQAELDRVRRSTRIPLVPTNDLSCPLLSRSRRCTIYSIRPAICRLYGLVRQMRCPHGCVPDRWVRDSEARRIIKDLENLGSNKGQVPLTGPDMIPPEAFDAFTADIQDVFPRTTKPERRNPQR